MSVLVGVIQCRLAWRSSGEAMSVAASTAANIHGRRSTRISGAHRK